MVVSTVGLGIVISIVGFGIVAATVGGGVVVLRAALLVDVMSGSGLTAEPGSKVLQANKKTGRRMSRIFRFIRSLSGCREIILYWYCARMQVTVSSKLTVTLGSQ